MDLILLIIKHIYQLITNINSKQKYNDFTNNSKNK